MTGFGQAVFDVGGWVYGLEVRTVNTRFLDIKLHLPWTDAALETRLRDRLRSAIARGRVDLTVKAHDSEALAAGGRLRLNAGLARAIGAALGELAATLGVDAATAVHLLPPQRDLLVQAPPDEADGQELEPRLLSALDEALLRLLALRTADGAAVREDLERRLSELTRLARQIRARTASEPEAIARRLGQRVAQLGIELDRDRLAQEVALLADRADVSEELSRLDSHLLQLRAMLAEPGAVGRKVEFMLQEVNREVNTIASKSTEAEVAALAVEAKSCLEKMREQAQNVE